MSQHVSSTSLGGTGDKSIEDKEDMPVDVVARSLTPLRSPPPIAEAEGDMLLFLKENPYMDFAAKRRSEFPADILWAARYGFAEAVKYLIDKGADLTVINNTVTGRKWSCLHYAAQAENENLEVMKLLVENLGSSKINDYRDSEGCTVLHIAARSPKESILRFLLDKGADVKAVMNTGDTPLHIAARQGSEKIIGMFISKGADLNANTNIGFTPLMYAAEAGNRKAVIKLLKTRQVDLENQTMYSGKTALHLAVEGGHLKVAKKLVGFGADIYSQNLLGKRVIDYTLEDLPRECTHGEAMLKLIKDRAD